MREGNGAVRRASLAQHGTQAAESGERVRVRVRTSCALGIPRHRRSEMTLAASEIARARERDLGRDESAVKISGCSPNLNHCDCQAPPREI